MKNWRQHGCFCSIPNYGDNYHRNLRWVPRFSALCRFSNFLWFGRKATPLKLAEPTTRTYRTEYSRDNAPSEPLHAAHSLWTIVSASLFHATAPSPLVHSGPDKDTSTKTPRPGITVGIRKFCCRQDRMVLAISRPMIPSTSSSSR